MRRGRRRTKRREDEQQTHGYEKQRMGPRWKRQNKELKEEEEGGVQEKEEEEEGNENEEREEKDESVGKKTSSGPGVGEAKNGTEMGTVG